MSLVSRAGSALARQNPSATRPRLIGSTRFVHGYHHLPFKWPGEKKAAFGAKLAVYLTTGFSIPFLASWYQLRKAGGAV